MRTSVIVSLCLCSLASASLRGSTSDKGVSIDLPGISINVPSNGSPSISIGGNVTGDGQPFISIGNNSVSIGGQTIDWGSNSTSNMTCDVSKNKSVWLFMKPWDCLLSTSYARVRVKSTSYARVRVKDTL